ncbi:MAG: mechanosensitive ion channel [Bacteroidales bacterium]|nr:mechanosensitive ion channel [Bacteroidales bacterium]
MEKYLNQIIEMFVDYGPRLLGGLVVLVVGLWLTGIVKRWVGRIMQKRELDLSLQPFFKSLIVIVLRVLVIITSAGMIGIQMTSFIAITGAATLAVGWALQGTLQNFAGGVLILMFRPFKIGDWIEAQGYSGSVSAIHIVNTVIKTADNKVVFIPNGGLANSAMINYTREEQRRVDWTFGIAYGDDVEKARQVLLTLIQADNRILTEPEPFVAVSSLGDSSVNLVVRVWVNLADYWGVFFDMNESVYKTFNLEGINIPFPQMDVHMHQ